MPEVSAPINALSQAFDFGQSRLALMAAGEMFKRTGPEGEAFADIIAKNPAAAAQLARQFGGFENLHNQLVLSTQVGAQAANANAGQRAQSAMPALPDEITTPQELAMAQNLLSMAGVPPSQWGAILDDRMPSQPKQVVVGEQLEYRDRFGRKIEGLGGERKTPGVTVNMPGEPRKFSDYNQMRKAYNEEQLPFMEASRALNKARALAAIDSPEANIDLITAIAKAVDPGSVVREGEIHMRINNAPLRRMLNRYLKRAIGNGGFLTIEDRNEMVQALEVITDSELARARAVEKAYRAVPTDPDLGPFVIPETVDDIYKRAKPLDEQEGKAFEVPRFGQPGSLLYEDEAAKQEGGWKTTPSGRRYRIKE